MYVKNLKVQRNNLKVYIIRFPVPYNGSIPLEEARLIIYAETPPAAMEIADKTLIITIHAGAEETALEYELK